VIDANQTQGLITWDLDLGGDPAPEVIGLIQFTNALGQPAEPPFDITQFVAAGLDTLDQFLDQLPDGWKVTITANTPAIPPSNVRFAFEYDSGAVIDVTGNGDIAGAAAGCAMTFTLVSADLADLTGAFPSASFDAAYNGATARLEGTTTFDGTDVVAVDGEINDGGAIYEYEVDLGAGTVTALP
jgi:flavin-binding protein dodecin